MFVGVAHTPKGSRSSIFRSGTFLGLVFFTLLYQVCYQYFMWRTLQQDFVKDEFSRDGDCIVVPGAVANSPECVEAHLFRSWQRESEHHAQVFPKSNNGIMQISLLSNGLMVPASADRSASAVTSLAVAHAAKDAAAKASEQIRAQLQELNTSADPRLEDSKMQEHFKALPGIHRKLTEEKLAELDIQLDASEREKELSKIYDKVSDALQSRSTFTDWDQSLVDMQAHLEKRHEELKHMHRMHEQAHKSHLRGHAHAALAEMNAHWDASHEDARAAHRAWEKNFSESMLVIGKELCAEPERLNSPACAAFTTANDPKNVKFQTHEQWEANFTNVTASLVHELCSDPRRANYAACLKDNQSKLQVAPVAPTPRARSKRTPALRGQLHSPHLHWTTVKNWKDIDAPHTMLRELVNVSHEQIRFVHWDSAVPKVGCITAVPSGLHARVQLRYFIENFKLQAYEGRKQLILVYHHADDETAELVKQYADGSNIKAVAARGEGAFPSTEALRFGAWSSDADVIAHWELDEFHHIDRLSVQVRAMALSQKPVSLFKEPATDKEATPENSYDTSWGRVETLAGEATWMRTYWSPLMHLEHSLLKVHAHQIVQVQM